MLALVELSRGHSESRMKSERSSAAWAKKKAAAGTTVVTKVLPNWVRYSEGKLVLIPEAVRIVRRVFALSIAGNGNGTICRKLNAERVPTLAAVAGKPAAPKKWMRAMVQLLLTSRSVIGEYQPHTGYQRCDRKPVGPPVLNYYPPAVDTDTFFAAALARKTREASGRGRPAKHVNLFAGLLRDAVHGGGLSVKRELGKLSILVPTDAKEGRSSNWCSFPADAFEEAVISNLVEVPVSAVNGDDDTADQKVSAIAGELAEVEGLLAKWKVKMDDPNLVDVVGAKLAELTARQKTLAGNLESAKRDASATPGELWGEFKGLAALLRSNPTPDLRLSVQAAIRRAVESVHCGFVGRWSNRYAAVRVQFRSLDYHRDFILHYVLGRRTWKQRPKSAVEFVSNRIVGGLDLRKSVDAGKVNRVLQKLLTGVDGRKVKITTTGTAE
jgi:hypothetical protein